MTTKYEETPVGDWDDLVVDEAVLACLAQPSLSSTAVTVT